MENIGILNRLAKAKGVTGFEEAEITETVLGLYREFTEGFEGAKVYSDVNGSAYAEVGSGEPCVMIIAHMDEIGMAVSGIEKNGMLRIVSVAGVDPRVLPGSFVRVCGKKELMGVVGAIPPHLTGSKKKAYKWEELAVDIGLSYEKASELVSIGDRVTFAPDPVLELKNGFVSSKSLDDRALILAQLRALEILKKRRFRGRVVMCASVNEEKTGLGAKTCAWRIKPDIAIIMDVTFGKSACDPDGFAMDKLALAVGPNIHPKVLGKLIEAADGAKIGWEYEPCMGATGTDATDVQISGLGIPCGLISPPLRYMHTCAETISLDTLLNCGALCAEFVTGIEEDWREGLCLD